MARNVTKIEPAAAELTRRTPLNCRRRGHETLINSQPILAPVAADVRACCPNKGVPSSRGQKRETSRKCGQSKLLQPAQSASQASGNTPVRRQTAPQSTNPDRAARSNLIQPYLGLSSPIKIFPRSRLNPVITPVTPLGRGRSQSEPSPVLFVRRPALINSQTPRPLLPPVQNGVATPQPPFASPLQGCASPGKATQGSREKTSASLACKASFLCPMKTPQPFAQKTPALLRFVARNCALSLIIARYGGIPLGIALSREWTRRHSPRTLTQINLYLNRGLTSISPERRAKIPGQSSLLQANTGQPPFLNSLQLNTGYRKSMRRGHETLINSIL
jgi:hypothetical protein